MSKIQLLVDEFDSCSQSWGWQSDQGYNDTDIQESLNNYNESKKALLDTFADLEKSARIPLEPTEEMIRAAIMQGNGFSSYEEWAEENGWAVDAMREMLTNNYKAMVSVV